MEHREQPGSKPVLPAGGLRQRVERIYPLQLSPDAPQQPCCRLTLCSQSPFCRAASCTPNPCLGELETGLSGHMASTVCPAADWFYWVVFVRDLPCSDGLSLFLLGFLR